MLATRTETESSIPQSNPNPATKGTLKKSSLYEQCREERIKENLHRLQNLGILNLSRKLQSEIRPVKRQYRKFNYAQKSTPPRRSSRLEKSTPVIYTDGINRRKVKGSKRENVRPVGSRLEVIGVGPRVEVYTEKHEKLLGNTERNWTSFVDGYGKNGKRIYDSVKGKTCHQCRQKTLGHRTKCSECDMVQGQFCGDCLFMRYGEHVLEALDNPNWVCPVCRGICNCSLCRNHKGWLPTGPIYRRIAKLGYKSVAHYLIQTKWGQTDDIDDVTPNQASAKRSLSFQEPTQISDNEVPKKEEAENMNSARRLLSFSLPTVDDQTSLVKEEEYSCDRELAVDVRVLSDETETSGLIVNTPEPRRSKRKAFVEPNFESIGSRLRQRRRSQSGL